MDRGEAVEAQRVAPELDDSHLVKLVAVKREFRCCALKVRCGFDQVPGHDVVVGVGAGPLGAGWHEGRGREIELLTVAAPHQLHFAERAGALRFLVVFASLLGVRQLLHGGRPVTIVIHAGQADVDVRRAVVGPDDIGIKLRGRRGGIGQQFSRIGLAEFLPCRRFDLAQPVVHVVKRLGGRPVVGAIPAGVRVPEHQILRVEIAVVEKDALLLGHRPMNAVRGFPHRQILVCRGPVARAHTRGDRLVERIRGRGRIFVAKHHQVPVVESGRLEDDVVRLGPIEFHQVEVRAVPVDAVPALRVTGEAGWLAGVQCPIIHSVNVAIPEDHAIATGITLPRLVVFHDHLARHGAVKDPLRPAHHALDHDIVQK